MRTRILLALSAILLLFAAGAVASMFYIQGVTRSLHETLDMHRIEELRRDLLVRIQTVQSDFYRVGTPLAEDPDRVVDDLAVLQASARRCGTCHHRGEQQGRIRELQQKIDRYQIALSHYLTAGANEEHVSRLRDEAGAIGSEVQAAAETMIHAASRNLQRSTVMNLERIDRTGVVLLGTLVLSLGLAVAAAAYLNRFVTRPVRELLQGTRAIEAGQLGYSIGYRDGTEFGELAEKFNAMSAKLKESYESLVASGQELRESERKFRTISEFTQAWEYWIGEDSRIIFMSPSCKEITGYSEVEFAGDPALIPRIVHPEDRQKFERHLESFRSDRRELEFRIVTRSGETRWISHVCGPIEAEGRFVGRRVSNRDVTDRKHLEERLLQSQKMESLGLMAGRVAHDFNNLLMVIRGSASLLEAGWANLNEKSRRHVAWIKEAAEKAEALTATLLAFSRKQVIRQEPLDLNEAVRAAATLVGRVIGEEVELKVSCSEAPLTVFADPHQLGHALVNLATNARDAMPNGGMLEIASAAASLDAMAAEQLGIPAGPYAALTVRDSGAGIDPKDLPHIFEPFFTTKDKGKGTGLGLSTVFGVVRQHGGAIGVESGSGAGTVFRIYLPLSDGEAVGRPLERKPQPPEAAGITRPRTLLVAEDEDLVRAFLLEVLQAQGYQVIPAADGHDAIEKFDAHRGTIDLALLDVVMPRRNGKEVYDHIRKAIPHLPVVFMSGYTRDILTSKGIAEEGLHFLSKPVAVPRLTAVVRAALGGHDEQAARLA